MALTPGTRLGPYEITGPLGTGGMGEVYRATDTKLGREVAIKTLPSALANEPERLARFEREAKLLAALNHANIGAIYGLDEHEGAQFLAMELIEGETLEEKLKAGALPVEDALPLALQIAEAVEAAHDKGVVHRDLKPANVMVTRDGVVKVLDFGLAKAFSGDPNAASPAHSPALSLAMTQQGLILGTAGYMSPEQASGQATDQRADIWAFGVVLYEMLTGLPAFSGESVPHILADVLRMEPNWDRLPTSLDPRIRQLLKRCLRKKVRSRYHSMADVRVDIEEVLSDPEGAYDTERLPVAAAAAGAARRRWRSPELLVGLVGVLLAIGASLVVWSFMRPAPGRVMRFDVSPESGFTVTDVSSSIALSPDGQRFAYVSGGAPVRGGEEIRLRDLGALESTLLVAETQIASPFFSPNGSEIGYYIVSPPTLKRVSTRGGPPSVVTALDASMNGASWSEDGRIFFATRNEATGLWTVAAVGGTAEPLTTPDTAQGEIDHFWPEVLPGGRAVLFTIVRKDTPQIAVLDLDTGTYRALVNGSFARYAPTGHLLYGLEGTLWAVGFDLDRLETTGAPIPVLEGIVTKGTDATEVALAADGSLLYIAGPAPTARVGDPESQLVWVDATGAETPLDAPRRAYEQLRVSPDGARVAVQIEDDIWIWDGPGRLDRLTFGNGPNRTPLWLADGTAVAYRSDRDGGGIFVQPSDGTGSARRLLDVPAVPFDEAADGAIVYMTLGALDIGVVPASGGSGESLIATGATEVTPALSPNGRWLAYVSDESGRLEIYVRGYPDVESLRRLVSTEGGSQPRWSPDGQTLYYLATDGQWLMAAAVVSEEPFSTRAPERMFSLEGLSVDIGNVYDVAPDGRFIFIRSNSDAANRLILVQNFLDELERLVPTK